jgi:hypothetical protein
MEHGARSYLDALWEYEDVTKEAIALARRKGSNARTNRETPRGLDLDGTPERDAAAAVMRRWHLALMAVLETGEQMFRHPLQLTTEDKAAEANNPKDS